MRSSALLMRGCSAVLAALILTACNGPGRYPEQCGTRLPGWRQPSDGYGVLALTNKVRVLRDGTINWNGKSITRAELAEYSAIVPDMNPIPFMILDIEPGAPCSDVMETRQIIDDKAKCRAEPDYSTCGEGPEPWALVGDVIGPDGKPPEPFYPKPITTEADNETR